MENIKLFDVMSAYRSNVWMGFGFHHFLMIDIKLNRLLNVSVCITSLFEIQYSVKRAHSSGKS